MRRSPAVAASLLCAALLAGCHRREPPEVTKTRVAARFLEGQIQNLEALVAKAEAGELDTENQIAVSISEDIVKQIFDASLPRELVLAGRLVLRLESAQPYFRGGSAALLLRAHLSSKNAPSAHATVELGGSLHQFELAKGQLTAQVEVAHFRVVEASVGDLAADVIQNLVDKNRDSIRGLIPPLVIPVAFEESVKIGGLDEGVVVAKPGQLPLAIKVAHVVPTRERLWVLLDAKAGPWGPLAAEAKK